MKNLPALDGLRAISILAVLSAHMLPLGPKQLQLNAAAAAMGMSLFFALSGFLITTTLLNGISAKAFFVRRFARILPLAYVYLALIYLVLSFRPDHFLVNFVFIENYVQTYLDGLTGHFWSLCVEVHFYVAIGISVAIFGRRAVWAVLPACLTVTALRIFDGVTIDIRTHLRVDEILAGAVVAIFYFKYKQQALRTNTWLFLVVAAFWFAASWPPTGVLQYARPYCSAALVATALCLERCLVLAVLSSRAARYISQISYALYIVHPLLMHGWMDEGSTLQKYLVKRPISFVLAFTLAHLSTFYWERRWIIWAKKLTARE